MIPAKAPYPTSAANLGLYLCWRCSKAHALISYCSTSSWAVRRQADTVSASTSKVTSSFFCALHTGYDCYLNPGSKKSSTMASAQVQNRCRPEYINYVAVLVWHRSCSRLDDAVTVNTVINFHSNEQFGSCANMGLHSADITVTDTLYTSVCLLRSVTDTATSFLALTVTGCRSWLSSSSVTR